MDEATSYIPTTFQYRISVREDAVGIRDATELVTQADRDDQYRRLASLIGNTPLLHTETRNRCHIITKWESANPTETHYDRAYLLLLRRLENQGIINPGDELIEITSGSAGTSFAWLAQRLGYRATIIVPAELPNGRIQEMINFGAEVIRSEPGYVAQAAQELRARIKEFKISGYDVDYVSGKGFNNVVTAQRNGHRACFVNHSEHDITVQAFEEIGRETARVMGDIPIDHFVSVLGNWTSTTGIARVLRNQWPDVRVTGLEDERAPKYFRLKRGLSIDEEGVFSQHDSFGSSAPNVRLRFDDLNIVDDIALINPDERNTLRDHFNGQYIRGSHRCIVETIGNTSAGALVQACRIADISPPGTTILTIAYDLIDRYGEPVQGFSYGSAPIVSANGQLRADTRTHAQRSYMVRPGYLQGRVNSPQQLPTSRIDVAAGGLSHPFLSWALS